MSFTKMSSGIINSSLWDEPAYVFKLFATFWAKCCNGDGVVIATKEAIYRASNISRDEFDVAIVTLTSPDKLSTSTLFDGKRILQESANKWLIVNYKQYRGEKEYSDKPEAVRKKTYRDTLKEKEDLGQCPILEGHAVSVSVSESVSALKKDSKKKTFIKPTVEEVKNYFKEKGYSENSALSFFEGYNVANWHDSNDKQIRNWKQKAIQVWFKEENKLKEKQPQQDFLKILKGGKND